MFRTISRLVYSENLQFLVLIRLAPVSKWLNSLMNMKEVHGVALFPKLQHPHSSDSDVSSRRTKKVPKGTNKPGRVMPDVDMCE